MKEYSFEVNGFNIKASYTQTSVNQIFYPLIDKLVQMQKQTNKRMIVFLVAPPATGKSTLAAFIEYLSNHKIQSVGMDGFHYPQAYLNQHWIETNHTKTLLANIKGSPLTFDVDKLKNKIVDMKQHNILFPIYDRKIHDVIEDKIKIEKDIILIEGNYLLLKDDKWNEIKKLCDYSIFISANESLLKERLIQRKVWGGLSRENAIAFYEKSDRKNIEIVLNLSQKADLELELLENNEYRKR